MLIDVRACFMYPYVVAIAIAHRAMQILKYTTFPSLIPFLRREFYIARENITVLKNN